MQNIPLNAVRTITDRERALKIKLQRLKDFQSDLSPKNDGTPCSQNHTSRLENLSVQIVDTENEIEKLTADRQELQFTLFNRLQANDKLTAKEFDVLYYRYICCLPFENVAKKIAYSTSRIFGLHRSALKKL